MEYIKFFRKRLYKYIVIKNPYRALFQPPAFYGSSFVLANCDVSKFNDSNDL